jgi:hypothetical protein
MWADPGAPEGSHAVPGVLAAQKEWKTVGSARAYAWRIYRGEALVFTVFVGTFVLFAAHLTFYPTLLGIEVVPHAAIPAEELTICDVGFSAMVILFLVEALYAVYLISMTWHDQWLIEGTADKLKGNFGVLLGEYTVVAATYWMMSKGLFPVFLAPLTGRRFQPLRLAEWAVCNCGLIYLDCRYVLGRPLQDFSYLFGVTFASIMCGLAAACIAPTRVMFCLFIAGAWYNFLLMCYRIITFEDKNTLAPAFGERPMNKDRFIRGNLFFCAGYGALFTVVFMTDNVVPQWTEQLIFSILDVSMKTNHCGSIMYLRAKQRPRLVGFRMPFSPDTASICLACYGLIFLYVVGI